MMPLVVEDQEYLPIPEEDRGNLHLAKGLEGLLRPLGDQTVAPPGAHDVRSLASVPGDAAVASQDREGNDPPVVLEHDPQRRGATLHGLHLENSRRLHPVVWN